MFECHVPLLRGLPGAAVGGAGFRGGFGLRCAGLGDEARAHAETKREEDGEGRVIEDAGGEGEARDVGHGGRLEGSGVREERSGRSVVAEVSLRRAGDDERGRTRG